MDGGELAGAEHVCEGRLSMELYKLKNRVRNAKREANRNARKRIEHTGLCDMHLAAAGAYALVEEWINEMMGEDLNTYAKEVER